MGVLKKSTKISTKKVMSEQTSPIIKVMSASAYTLAAGSPGVDPSHHQNGQPGSDTAWKETTARKIKANIARL